MSESASSVLPKQSAMLVMRSLISDIVAKESELLAQYDALEEKSKCLKSLHEKLKYIFSANRDRLRGICHDKVEDGAMDELYVNAIVEECKNRLATYCIDPTEEQEYQRLLRERDNALFENQQSAELFNASLQKYKEDRRNFNELKKECQTSKSNYSEEELDEIQIAAQQHPTRKYCCVPLAIAKEHKCPWVDQYTQIEDTDSKEILYRARSVFQNNIIIIREIELKKSIIFSVRNRNMFWSCNEKVTLSKQHFKISAPKPTTREIS